MISGDDDMIVETYDHFCQRLLDIGVALSLSSGPENFACLVISEVFRLQAGYGLHNRSSHESSETVMRDISFMTLAFFFEFK